MGQATTSFFPGLLLFLVLFRVYFPQLHIAITSFDTITINATRKPLITFTHTSNMSDEGQKKQSGMSYAEYPRDRESERETRRLYNGDPQRPLLFHRSFRPPHTPCSTSQIQQHSNED